MTTSATSASLPANNHLGECLQKLPGFDTVEDEAVGSSPGLKRKQLDIHARAAPSPPAHVADPQRMGIRTPSSHAQPLPQVMLQIAPARTNRSSPSVVCTLVVAVQVYGMCPIAHMPHICPEQSTSQSCRT